MPIDSPWSYLGEEEVNDEGRREIALTAWVIDSEDNAPGGKKLITQCQYSTS